MTAQAVLQGKDADAIAFSNPVQPRAESSSYRPFGILRTTLAGLVMLHHFGIHLAGPDLAAALRQIDLGRLAVVVFFVLSGFVIAEAAVTFYSGRPLAFASNRLLRIVPPLFAAILLSLLLQTMLNTAGVLQPLEGEHVTAANLGWHGLLVNTLALLPGTRLFGLQPDYLLIRYIWTIRVELLFYITVAIALGILKHASSAPALLLGAICCIYPLFWPDGGAFEFAGYFGCGVTFYLLLSNQGYRPALVVLLGVSLIAAFRQLVQDAEPGFELTSALILAALLGLIALLSAVTRLSSPLRRLDQAIGGLSYPLYLNHYVVGTLAASLWPVPGIPRLLVATGAALLLAVGMDWCVEPLLTRVRARIRRPKSVPVQLAAQSIPRFAR